MSVETELDTFRAIAIEAQQALNDKPLEREAAIGQVTSELDQLLLRSVGGSMVYLSGEMYVPHYDQETGALNPSDYHLSTARVIPGVSNGVYISSNSKFRPYYEGDEVSIGFSVRYAKVQHTSPLAAGMNALYAFAPVEGSRLYVPEHSINSVLEQSLLDDTGEIFHKIDECVMEGAVDTVRLAEIFDELTEQDDAELVVSQYQAYLNAITNISEADVSLTSVSLLDSALNERTLEGHTYTPATPLQRFVYVDGADTLCIEQRLYGAQGATVLYIPVRAVSGMTLTKKESNPQSFDN